MQRFLSRGPHRIAATVVLAALGLALWTVQADAAEPMGTQAFRVVSPAWVFEHSGDADVCILDVRTSVKEYQYGHVPGAVFVANDVFRVPRAGLPVQYLDPEEMAAIFRRAGVDRGDTAIVYAGGDSVLGATMVAYCLHRIGHENVAIMDGGIDAFRMHFPLTQSYPEVSSGSVQADLDRSIFVTLETIRDGKDLFFLDTRPAPDYLGNTSRWMRNGHIPGAVNLDWHRLMQPGNPHAFRTAGEMRDLIESTGVQVDDDVVVYCGTSREATLVYQVMRHVLGFDNVRLYEGSWTEYCAHTDLPVARAPEGPMAGAVAHRPPTADRLEPYQCGDVQRLHTFKGIFLASQPQPDDFRQARKGGIKTVINQRHESEIRKFDERELLTDLGMTYYNPAWNGPEELTDAVIDENRMLLRTVERPVLMHCSSANRTGAIWLAYGVLDRGLSWEEALAEAKTVGLRSPDYEKIVRDYVERMQKKSEQR